MSPKKLVSLSSALRQFELNDEQKVAVECILNNKIVILRGAAGSAKSFTAVYAALRLLANRSSGIGKISLTRPMVTTEKMGFLPGDLGEKYAPYMLPLVEFFNKMGDAGDNTYSAMIAAKKVQERPIAFLRGSTIEDEILIADEMQNSTPEQMLLVLTRIGHTGKLVVTGDQAQSDLGTRTPSGLDYLIALAERLPYIQDVQLKTNMRDPMINEIIEHWGIGVV